MSNPLVERILSNPLSFVAAKNPEREAHTEKPASYIVLTKKSHKSPELPAMIRKKPVKAEQRKPQSMAEAIAAYTGRMYLTKAEKKRNTPKPVNVVGSESSGESQYESASEFQTDSSFQGFRSSSEERESGKESERDMKVRIGDDSDRDDEESEDSEDSEETEESEEPDGSNYDSKDTESEPINEPKNELIENENKSGDIEDSEDLGTPVDLAGNQTNVQLDDEDDEDETFEDEDDNDDDDESSSEDADDEDFETSDNADTSSMTPESLMQQKEELLKDASRALPNTSKAQSLSPPAEQPVSDTPLDHYGLQDDSEPSKSSRISKSWNQNEKSLKPVGLLNFGVTCYMNSAIQTMVHIPAVQHYLQEVHAGKHAELKPRSVTHTLAAVSAKMWTVETGRNGARKYVNPKKIVQRLEDINCTMSEWQQEDSHEYFMSLMSRLQEDSTPKGRKLNESIIYYIFGGVLDQEVICQTCHTVSRTKQELYDVSLGLNKRKMPDDENAPATRYTMEKSIRDFFGTETIKIDKNDASSGYYCEKCKKRTVATKKSTIEKSPETLMVHLKRFKFNGNSLSKVKQPIVYLKYLDLGPYTSHNEASKYQLMSVIVHEGRSILSGHYIAHCLQPDGSWSTYDDEYINKIDERAALSDPSAYCLVYTKLTPKNKRRRTEANGTKRARLE